MAYLENFTNEKDPTKRNFEATVIVGEKRTGKSSVAKILIDLYAESYPSAKILAYDISEAFGKQSVFKGYPVIKESELLSGVLIKNNQKYKWLKGVKRITNIEPDVFLKFAGEKFTDGLLFIDEATTLFNPNPSVAEKKFMTTHTNHRCDGLYVFHRLQDIPKSLRNSFWKFIIFSTGDNISRLDRARGIKDIEDMGFQHADHLYDAWKAAQVPEKRKKIIQKFTVHKKKLDNE